MSDLPITEALDAALIVARTYGSTHPEVAAAEALGKALGLERRAFRDAIAALEAQITDKALEE